MRNIPEGPHSFTVKKAIETVFQCSELVSQHLTGEKRDIHLKQMQENMLSICILDNQFKTHEKYLQEIEKSRKSVPSEGFVQMYKALKDKTKPFNPESHPAFKQLIEKLESNFEVDEDLAITDSLASTTDPFTMRQMVDPVRNTTCGHVYEKSSIESILKKKRGIKCPVVGCPNTALVTLASLEPDTHTKMMIERQAKQNSVASGSRM